MIVKINPKRIFISTGMYGVNPQLVKDRIKEVTDELYKAYGQSIEIVHNFDTTGSEADGRMWYLGEAIKKLDKCDTIFMCRGWRNHIGCIHEHNIANDYGLAIMYESIGGK